MNELFDYYEIEIRVIRRTLTHTLLISPTLES